MLLFFFVVVFLSK